MGAFAMKKFREGYYLRYDGALVYALARIKNEDTGEWLILCKRGTPKREVCFAVGEGVFRGSAETGGGNVPRYRRCSKSHAVSEAEAQSVYEKSGAYPPEEAIRAAAPAPAAEKAAARAKAISESYLRDLRVFRQGVSAAGTAEYERAKENVLFLQRCLSGELKEYAAYFRERFIEGVSIRNYAKFHGINRGSAAYLQKKYFGALAHCIAAKDR